MKHVSCQMKHIKCVSSKRVKHVLHVFKCVSQYQKCVSQNLWNMFHKIMRHIFWQQKYVSHFFRFQKVKHLGNVALSLCSSTCSNCRLRVLNEYNLEHSDKATLPRCFSLQKLTKRETPKMMNFSKTKKNVFCNVSATCINNHDFFLIKSKTRSNKFLIGDSYFSESSIFSGIWSHLWYF